MDDLESKLGSMLSNPELMQQVMSLAQSLGQSQGSPPSEPHPQAPLPASGNPLGDLNPAMLTQIAGIASKFMNENYMANFSEKWYVLFFYVLNFIMVAIDLVLYYRNKRIDKKNGVL